jgi:hypothetical protein
MLQQRRCLRAADENAAANVTANVPVLPVVVRKRNDPLFATWDTISAPTAVHFLSMVVTWPDTTAAKALLAFAGNAAATVIQTCQCSSSSSGEPSSRCCAPETPSAPQPELQCCLLQCWQRRDATAAALLAGVRQSRRRSRKRSRKRAWCSSSSGSKSLRCLPNLRPPAAPQPFEPL